MNRFQKIFSRIRSFCAGAVMVLTSLAPIASESQEVFVLHDTGIISVLDEADLTMILATFTTGTSATTWMAVNPTATRLYVTDNIANMLFVFDITDPAYPQVAGSPVATGMGPRGVIVDATGSYVYVINNLVSTYMVFDANTLALVLPETATGGMGPYTGVANPAGGRIYIANESSGTITVIDTSTHLPILGSPFPAGIADPSRLGINPSGTSIYAGSFMTNDVVAIDALTMAVLATAPSGGLWPQGFAVNPAGTELYVTNTTSGTLSILDPATLAPLMPPVPVAGSMGLNFVAPSPDGTQIYLPDNVSDALFVLDSTTFMQIAGSPFITGDINALQVAFSTPVQSLSEPPSSLTGVRRRDDFGVIYELYNAIAWQPSPTVGLGYRIYRNGALIATVDAATLSYEDHNLPKSTPARYEVTSLNGAGIESAPIEFTVQ